jgi:predicted nucleic acid-binding protein
MKRCPVAFLDACVLVPMPLADLLLRLAEPVALFEARWSDGVLAEVTRTLMNRFGKSPEKARYREAAMREFFRDALVTDYDALIGQMRNHPKDRHVLAAAVTCKADFLVTFNLRDFPVNASPGQPAVVGPAEFLKGLWQMDPYLVEERIREQAEAIGISPETLLDKLARSVPGFVEVVRDRSKSGRR